MLNGRNSGNQLECSRRLNHADSEPGESSGRFPRFWDELCHLWTRMFCFIFKETFDFVMGYSRLTSNVMIISGEQRRDSAIHIRVSILPQIPLPSRLPHNIEQSSAMDFWEWKVDRLFTSETQVRSPGYIVCNHSTGTIRKILRQPQNPPY